MRLSPPVRVLFTCVALAALAAGTSACGSSDSSSGPTTTTTAAKAPSSGTTPSLKAPCGRSSAPPKTYDHVVMVLEENRTWSGGRTPAVGLAFSGGKMPFLNGLAQHCTTYADWTETDGEQNSLNQYVGLVSGVDNTSTVNDCNPSDTCRSTDDNIFRQIRETGGTPRTFVDGATEACSAGKNAAKHIPALYFQGGDDASHCNDEVLPFSELDPDHLPTLAFIVPDLCHDGHDCPDATVDDWAKSTLTPILDGADYAKGRTLVVVIYDEDQPVPNLLIAPTAHEGTLAKPVGSHAALLKTIEQALGLPVLKQGQMVDAISLRKSAHL
ncbi:MAG: hypothetical protein JWM89_2106 [Acidimicrobiales bacterium]|nr:hypothetical protein [Acidimicrobiales bacterium]